MSIERVQESSDASNKTWLVFMAGETPYAIDSSSIKEILRNNAVFPLPFAPSYLKGVLNSYGIPFAVIDIAKFMEQDALESKMFLILNHADHVALQISDIQEFHNLNDVTEQSLAQGAESAYFNGAIKFGETTAPVLNLEGILKKVHSDFEK